jgi:hypothetical protein
MNEILKVIVFFLHEEKMSNFICAILSTPPSLEPLLTGVLLFRAPQFKTRRY